MATSAAVTLVIPIYGDLNSLVRCIDSVLETVDLTVHRLLLVNDCGPDADVIENAVLERVSGHPAVRYERNDHNLGFVGTCNRAVMDLDDTDNDVLLLNSDARFTPGAFDEMIAVLHADEKHGVVHPRSNNAAIASVPILPIEAIGSDDGLSQTVYAQLSDHLERYTVTPVAVGFCFLVRRQLIRNYGFFDEIYSPGYSEENDFCMRVNRFGYSSVLANRAFVHHEGSKSFSSPSQVELQRRNEDLMVGRYPYYNDAVAHYLQFKIDGLDWFADRIFGTGRKRVLIDLFHMSLIYNGSTRNALSFLDLLSRRRAQFDFDIVIVSSQEAIEFFDLTSYGFPVVANGKLEETFDLGFALSPVSDSRQINVLNRHCVRWVVSHFDIIALRINGLLELNYTRRQVVLDSLVWADRVIPISHAALDDIESFFGRDAATVRGHSTVIHEGVATTGLPAAGASSTSWGEDVAALVKLGGYALVVGNIFSHKQLPEALEHLAGAHFPVIAFGNLGDRTPPEGVRLVTGGMLSDAQVDELYRHAGCVVFPSSYEGFGLPIAEASQRGRPLVLFDMAVSREVVASLGVEDLVRYFSGFDTLLDTVEASLNSPGAVVAIRNRPMRTLDEYNSDVLDVLVEVLATPVDLEHLRERISGFRRIEVYADTLERRVAQLSANVNSSSYRAFVRVSRVLRPFRPALRVVWLGVRRLRR